MDSDYLSESGCEMRRKVMQTIEIFTENIETGTGHSSKGNQLKWEQDGWWYKADAFGYESLAEVVVSRLLEHSNIAEIVHYEPVNIRYRGRQYRGCRSRNFRREREEIVTLERLARTYTGFSLAKELAHIADVRQRVRYTEELVRNVTGIEDFGGYITRLLEIDAFFLNEDRHTNNIAVLYDTEKKEYRLCPFFDMGLSLFSDTREEYPLGKTFAECREQICAKPFCRDFDEQMDAANELYGCYLRFDIPARGIATVLEEPEVCDRQTQATRMQSKGAVLGPMTLEKEGQESAGVLCQGYAKEETERVREVLRYQAGKYRYMFAE